MRFFLFLLSILFSHTGFAVTQVDPQDIRTQNVIQNSGFENQKAKWTKSGSSVFALVTSGANLSTGFSTASWDASAASEALTSSQATIPSGMYSQTCFASFKYKGGDANITAQVIDGSIAVLSSSVLAVQSSFTVLRLPAFSCPTSGTIAIRLFSTGNAAIVYVDEFFLGTDSSGPGIAVNPVVYSSGTQTLGAVGSSGQIAASHILADSSFPAFTTETSYWHLRADVNDSTSNARNLTSSGSPGFTGTDTFGSTNSALYFNGSTQYAFYANAFFNFTPVSQDFALGGWFKATDWTPTADDSLVEISGSTGLLARIAVKTTGNINIVDAVGNCIAVTNPGFTDNTWHSLILANNSTTDIVKFFIDGKLAGSCSNANMAAPTGAGIGLQVAATVASAALFDGSISELFFTKSLLSDEQVLKLYSYKVSHNLAVAVASQDWKANFLGQSATTPLDPSFVTHMTTNDVFWDLSGFNSASQIAITMADKGISPTVIPSSNQWGALYTATPSWPITHGLGQEPYSCTMRYSNPGGDSAGMVLPCSDYCKYPAASTINCPSLPYAVSAGNTLELRLTKSQDAASVVENAGATKSGILSATAQSVGGVKTFVDGAVIKGVTDGSSAAAGYIGELLSGTSIGSPVSMTNNTYHDLTSVSLSTGEWDIQAVVRYIPASTTVVSRLLYAITTTPGNSGTGLLLGQNEMYEFFPTGYVPTDEIFRKTTTWRVRPTTTTIYYVKGFSSFTTSTMQGEAFVRATRVR